VFGLTTDQAIAYAAIVNTLSVVALAFITGYYAWQSKRQVTAANRQADAAQKTLDLLLREKTEQRQIDISTVGIQLESATHMIDDWLRRVSLESYDIPEVIDITPANLINTIQSAYRIDADIAGHMHAGLQYIEVAETDIRAMQLNDPSLHQDSPMAMGIYTEARKKLQDRAAHSLNIARSKFESAKSRFDAITATNEKGKGFS
jgi:hypothetical protein